MKGFHVFHAFPIDSTSFRNVDLYSSETQESQPSAAKELPLVDFSDFNIYIGLADTEVSSVSRVLYRAGLASVAVPASQRVRLSLLSQNESTDRQEGVLHETAVLRDNITRIRQLVTWSSPSCIVTPTEITTIPQAGKIIHKFTIFLVYSYLLFNCYVNYSRSAGGPR